MHSDDIIISARKLTKTYRLFGHPGDRIKQFFSLGLKQYHREFTALNDISFDIRRGESIGIIGRNGSGKSTLLQLICGILKPSSGSVTVNGSVSALLELGAGFNPEFTGRENVFFQGALMGFSKGQMEEKFDDIAAFADIGEFIDQPVRIYSSGMFVRLAFAVSVSLAPEILVVDEALAVGDFAFRTKCYTHIKRLTDSGMTLLLVSHDLETLKLICNRTVYLENGRIKFCGDSGEACDAFMARERSPGSNFTQDGTKPVLTSPAPQGLEKIAEIVNVTFSSPNGRNGGVIPHGAEIVLAIHYRILQAMDTLTIAMHIRDERNLEIVGTNTRIEGCDIASPRAGDTGTLSFRFPNLLRSGNYCIAVGLAADYAGQRVFPDWREEAVTFRSAAGKRWALIGPPVTITHQPHDRVL